MKMRKIRQGDIPTKDLHQFMVGAIAPRPIAFVSTIDDKGVPNVAPYSFFNAFSSNPPILVFSSNRRVADNTTKDTLHNVKLNSQVVVNVVNYSMVRQMAIASVSYPSDVNEFEKAGLHTIPFVNFAARLLKTLSISASEINLLLNPSAPTIASKGLGWNKVASDSS